MFVTVYFQQDAILVRKHVADEMGLRDGQEIATQDHLLEILRKNTEYMIPVIAQRIFLDHKTTSKP